MISVKCYGLKCLKSNFFAFRITVYVVGIYLLKILGHHIVEVHSDFFHSHFIGVEQSNLKICKEKQNLGGHQENKTRA